MYIPQIPIKFFSKNIGYAREYPGTTVGPSMEESIQIQHVITLANCILKFITSRSQNRRRRWEEERRSEREEEESASRATCAGLLSQFGRGQIRPYGKMNSTHTPVGPSSWKTLKMTFFRETWNYNGTFQNKRIVMVDLQTLRIIMVPIQITLVFTMHSESC
jgi:hypothetical protein